jgi:hypothetical protein
MLFSPSTVVASDLAAAEPANTEALSTPAAQTQVQAPAETVPAAQVVDSDAIARAIAADRQEREARAKDAQERDSYKTRAEAAEAKLAEQEKAKRNRMLDPAGFLRKMGYTDRELALTSEGIMYSLVPDKAPADHRANLVAAQLLRDQEDRDAREAAAKAEAERAAQTQVQQHQANLEAQYTASLKDEASKFSPGAFPACQAWFEDDHDAYSQELLATAKKLAVEARAAGKVIDLSAQAVAPHLEKKYAAKVAKLRGAAATQTQVQPAAVAQPVTPQKTTSVLEEKKTPVKLTEKEIIDRATKAAFGLRD